MFYNSNMRSYGGVLKIVDPGPSFLKPRPCFLTTATTTTQKREEEENEEMRLYFCKRRGS